MTIEEGHLIHFLPPLLDGSIFENKRRYMLVININNENNTVGMLNITKLKNAYDCLYENNLELKPFFPLHYPSIVKLDTLYITDNFNGLERLIDFNGTKINHSELQKIKRERYNYIKNCNQIKTINYTETDIRKYNSEVTCSLN